ncbi:MAG: polysaccharide biosynthesis tyrosine autokinase [Verrucomicrobiota bacterium]
MKFTGNTNSAANLLSDLRLVFKALREHRRLIVLCVICAGLLGVFLLLRSPAIYSGRAVIEVAQEEPKVVTTPAEAKPAEEGKISDVLKTVEQRFTSPELLLRVIQKNNLQNDPTFCPGVPRPAMDITLERAFASSISAKLRPDTRLIDVMVEDRSPAMAQRLANSLVEEFIDQSLEIQANAAKRGMDFFQRESARLKRKLAQSEEALQAYKEQHHAVSLQETQNIVADKLRELNLKVTAAKADRLKLEVDNAQIAMLKSSAPEQLLQIPSVANLPAVAELKQSITEKEAQNALLQQRYKPEHPKYIEARTELQALHASLNTMLHKAADMVATSYDAATRTEGKLQDALHEQEQKALELNRMAIEHGALVRDVETDRALYDSIARSMKENEVNKQVVQNGIHFVSHPLLADQPDKPKKGLSLLLSLLGGLMVGCGISLVRMATDRSLKSVGQAEEQLGMTALGAIPSYRRTRKAAANGVLPIAEDPVIAESFRTLRAGLSLLTKGAESHVFLFASATPGEGKTFCAVNCAAAFAQLGLKTLLIDADLRQPSISGWFPKDAKPLPGLTDYLMGSSKPEEVVQQTGCANLSVICAGTPTDRPAELLAQRSLGVLLEKLNVSFDRIIIDTAPVNAVSDALLLLKYVESVCLVALAGKTPENAVLNAARKLEAGGVPPVGFILNRAPSAEGGYRHPYPTRPEPAIRRAQAESRGSQTATK